MMIQLFQQNKDDLFGMFMSRGGKGSLVLGLGEVGGEGRGERKREGCGVVVVVDCWFVGCCCIHASR